MKTLSAIATLLAGTTTIGTNFLGIATNPTADDTVTIGDTTYTFKAAAAADREVTIGADAAGSIDNLVADINSISADTRVTALAVTGGLVIFDHANRGPVDCSETLTAAADVWDTATTLGAGNDQDDPELGIVVSRTTTAAEVTASRMIVGLPFTPTAATVQVQTAGSIKAWDGTLTLGTNHIQLASDGATDLAENDVVVLTIAM